VALTHTYEIRQRLVDLLGGFRVFTNHVRAYSIDWPVEHKATEECSASANTANVSERELYEHHPLIPVHGVFRDDPTWDSFMSNVREYRRQVNETDIP
jgi:hypothetical protein